MLNNKHLGKLTSVWRWNTYKLACRIHNYPIMNEKKCHGVIVEQCPSTMLVMKKARKFLFDIGSRSNNDNFTKAIDLK